MEEDDCVLIVLAILFPPVAVAVETGFSVDLLLNIVLFCLIFFIPGYIHAFWLIWRKDKAKKIWGPGNVRYAGPIGHFGPRTLRLHRYRE